MPRMFTSFVNVKCPANQIHFFLPTIFEAAAYRYISVLSIFSAFQDDGFLGIFFPIQFFILDCSLQELLATILHVLI